MIMRFENTFCITSIFIYCRYWCSTKVDNELEHIGGQGNWGFCRQSCPPITPMEDPIEILPTTPTPTEKSEVPDIFSQISTFEGFEQRNQNECKFQNIYEAQKPINLCSQRSSKNRVDHQ